MNEKISQNPMQSTREAVPPISHITPPHIEWANAADNVRIIEDAVAALGGLQSHMHEELDKATKARQDAALNVVFGRKMPIATPALEVADAEEVSREVVNVQGVGRVDLSTYPEGHPIRQLAAEQARARSAGGAAVEQEQQTTSRRWTKKRLGMVAAGAIILAGGTVTGINFASSSTTAAVAGEKNVTPVNPETVPPLAPAALAESFVGCLDDKGSGKAINVGSVTSEVNSAWLMDLNGKSYKAEFQLGTDAASIAKPTVQLDGYINYAACIPADKVAGAVTVGKEGETPVVTVNLDTISPEVYVGINKFDRGYPVTGEDKLAGMDVMTAAAVKAKAIPDATAKALNDSYVDKANAAAEVTAAQRQTADLLAKADGMYASQGLAVLPDTITKRINAKVAILKSQGLSLVESVTVKFTGKLKAMAVKNAEAPKADKFSVDPASLTVTGFAVTAPTQENTK
jgi:hypothetical protein